MLTLNAGINICYISNETSMYESAFEVESNSSGPALVLANSNKTKIIIHGGGVQLHSVAE